MTFFKEVTINTDNPTGDAFGRVRTTTPVTLFDAKQLYDNAPLFWDDQETSGSGTGSSYSSDRASSTLSVSDTTAGTRLRQTFQRFNYQPGKSFFILMTGILDKSGGGTDITRRIGHYDDDNGLFFEDSAGTYRVVRRSNVTGSPVDTAVNQSAWNIDPMDGTGNSGITIDFTKTQIFVIDFEWLGVGRVRFGFNIDGVTYYCHQFLNANNLDAVYMSTPNLPLRYEIINGGTGSASELECICTSVLSEGGQEPTGILRYFSTGGGVHVDAQTADTTYAIAGIRLKSAYIGTTINLTNMSMVNETGDDYEWLLIFNPTVADTFTYSDLTNSAVQTAKGAEANTVTGGTQIDGGFVKSGGTSGSITISLDNALRLGAAIDGTVDEIVLCARPLTNGANIHAAITWRELS